MSTRYAAVPERISLPGVISKKRKSGRSSPSASSDDGESEVWRDMDTVYINLTKREDRKKLIQTEMRNQGLKGLAASRRRRATRSTTRPSRASWHSGLNCLFDKKTIPAMHTMSKGERGCSGSHVALWKQCARKDDHTKPMLVLEDDAVLWERSGVFFPEMCHRLIAAAEQMYDVATEPLILYVGCEVTSWRDLAARRRRGAAAAEAARGGLLVADVELHHLAGRRARAAQAAAGRLPDRLLHLEARARGQHHRDRRDARPRGAEGPLRQGRHQAHQHLHVGGEEGRGRQGEGEERRGVGDGGLGVRTRLSARTRRLAEGGAASWLGAPRALGETAVNLCAWIVDIGGAMSAGLRCTEAPGLPAVARRVAEPFSARAAALARGPALASSCVCVCVRACVLACVCVCVVCLRVSFVCVGHRDVGREGSARE